MRRPLVITAAVIAVLASGPTTAAGQGRAGTWESHHAISNLMFRYAEFVDQANFDGLSALFAHGQIRSTSMEDNGQGMTGAAIGKFYAATNRVHEDGTLLLCRVSGDGQVTLPGDCWRPLRGPLRARQRRMAFCRPPRPSRPDREHGRASFFRSLQGRSRRFDFGALTLPGNWARPFRTARPKMVCVRRSLAARLMGRCGTRDFPGSPTHRGFRFQS